MSGRPLYSRLVVGVDGLQGGADAAALAAMLGSPGALITLVYVSTVPFAGHASTRELDLADDTSLAALLTAERDLCGVEPEVLHVLAPTVGAGLELAAEQRDADLLVVGASRRHGLARLAGGDDARSVLRRAPCVVALAPSRYAHHPQPPVRVGVVDDASEESEVAVAHAGLIAAELRAQLRAQQVADVEHLRGPVGDALVEFSNQVDLLVCGSRRGRPLWRLAEGSTGEELARRVRIPLVITPPSDPSALDRWRSVRQPATA